MLKQRVLTGVIAVLTLLLVIFVLPANMLVVVLSVLMLAAAWEWSGLLSLESGLQRSLYVVFVGVLMALAWRLEPDFGAVDKVLIIALLWWMAALVWIFLYPTPISRPAGWLCGVLVLLPAFMALGRLYFSGPNGPQLLLLVLVIVWAADIGAYFAGRRIGKHKLAPRVSPGKTWEGVAGGMLTVLGLSLLSAVWLEVSPLRFSVLCLAVAAVSIVGDLTVSMFKRNAGIKDSGRLFPGHGGVLDRIDSVTAAAPVFLLGMVWLGLAA